MKLSQLLEASGKKAVIIFPDAREFHLYIYSSAKAAWEQLVQDGPAEDAADIVIAEFSGNFQGLEMGQAHPEEVVVNGEDDNVVYVRRNGKVLTDIYNLNNPVGVMIDDDNPQAAALAKKLADRKAKK